jgi:hypothetical protein
MGLINLAGTRATPDGVIVIFRPEVREPTERTRGRVLRR